MTQQVSVKAVESAEATQTARQPPPTEGLLVRGTWTAIGTSGPGFASTGVSAASPPPPSTGASAGPSLVASEPGAVSAAASATGAVSSDASRPPPSAAPVLD